MFEGVVGRNGLGNIAIDDISIAPGVCPTAPQVQTGPVKVRDEIMIDDVADDSSLMP